ncbi:DHA2 family efflux MFS transporter permease subunit [Streptomyces sp. WMMC500]|uniref:DHA2 family efflux MFS transporter permease subunit n=1 Tax=Streptomyces sp. WMMC500 TaxID=3015154 RepID=UPI00248B259C|nr:DHA2 family efflux MFS transporter permease subunit [Streptomyces sp. WMMC500]WBB61014.1 DHA2 family efflux MFS transporter permease subunit [Streptomyces sp. WMMC500]
MSSTDKEAQGGSALADADPRRWTALGVLTAMQFMLMMDVTVVNIALPEMERDLDFSPGGLAWVVNAYVLTAGGFLLLGGRLADMFGRRKIFVTGVLVFGISSIVCGAAANSGMLVAGRFVQGFGEALAGPAALGLIPVLFRNAKERTKALGIWGGAVAVGGAVGSVVGGALTDLVDWRWIFFINVPVAVFALIMVPRVLPESRMTRASGKKIDVVGAVSATGGLVAIVYGLLQAADDPWGSTQVLLPLFGGIGLLMFMAVWESRVPDPMIPLRFFTNRTRVTTNGVSVLALAAFYTYAFLLTLYLQQVLDYSPMETGLAYIPFTVAIGIGMAISTTLLPRIGVKPILMISFLGSAAGLVLAAGGLATDASFVSGIMPGLLVYGFFNSVGFPALTNGALHEVTGQDAGLASGMQTAMQQVGGSLGLATLVPLALRYVNDHVADGDLPQIAQTEGYALALRAAAGVLVVATLLVLLLMDKVDSRPRDAVAEATEGAAAEEEATRAPASS